MSLRRVPIESVLDKPVLPRRDERARGSCLASATIFFPADKVGKLNRRLLATVVREERTSHGNTEVIAYRAVTNDRTLKTFVRRVVNHHWPVPARQLLALVVVDGPAYPVKESGPIWARIEGSEVLVYSKDPYRIHYVIGVQSLAEQKVIFDLLPSTSEVLIASDWRKLFQASEAEVFQAVLEETEEGKPDWKIIPARQDITMEWAEELQRELPVYDQQFPGPEAVEVLVTVPATLVNTVARMGAFSLTREAEKAVREVLRSPQTFIAPVTGKIVDMRQGSAYHVIVIRDEAGNDLEIVVPASFEPDDGLPEDGVDVSRGQALGYSWAPGIADREKLPPDAIHAAFPKLFERHPTNPDERLIRVDYLPEKLISSVAVRRGGKPEIFWRPLAPAIRVELLPEEGRADLGAWKLSLEKDDGNKEEKKSHVRDRKKS